MSRFATRRRSAAALVLALPLVAGLAAIGAQAAVAHPARSTTKWTTISANTDLGIVSPGLFRTGDGRLHVIWPKHDGGSSFSLHYSIVGGATKLLATGTILSKWGAIAMGPRLLPGQHGGLQLLMDGGDNVPGSPYNTGAMYLATSNESGKTWKLVPGSLASTGFVPLTDTAAAAEPNGTPVAAWSEVTSLAYHVGVDPHSPATSPDQHVGIGAGGALTNPTLVTTTTGQILAGWFNTVNNSNWGYWTDQIWPSQKPKIKAPNSGGPKLANAQPLGPVALVAHPGGGSYLAYCVPTATRGCGHIGLWRVGAAKTLTVPGSSSGNARFVTIAAGHGGHLWISWFDTSTSKISVVRTNAAVNRFGAVRTISAPGPLSEFLGLSSVGGSGPLDVIALAALNHPGATAAYFDTELFPALRIHASKTSVSNQHSTTITFTVDDSGDAVAGVKVSFLGKTATTNAKGVVKFTVKKGTAKGKHAVVATKSGYASATATVKVT